VPAGLFSAKLPIKHRQNIKSFALGGNINSKAPTTWLRGNSQSKCIDEICAAITIAMAKANTIAPENAGGMIALLPRAEEMTLSV